MLRLLTLSACPVFLKVTKWTPTTQAPPMFVSMILDPIWQLYDAAVRDKNGTKAGRMAGKLGLDIPPRELASSDPRTVLQVRSASGPATLHSRSPHTQ